MDGEYQKNCVKKTDLYTIYRGNGRYSARDQRELPHYDADMTLTYLKKCEGRIRIEGQRYDIRHGDIVIMNSHEIHCSEIKDGSFHERISICMNASVLRRYLKDGADVLDIFFLREKGQGNIIPEHEVRRYGMDRVIEDACLLSAQNDSKSNIRCTLKIMELLLLLDDFYSKIKENPISKAVSNPMVTEVIGYIDLQFSTIRDCEEIAERFFVNRCYLEHLFSRNVGIPLWNYVILKRLLYTNDLLRAGHSSKEAAISAGFTNYSNFFRLYKKNMHMTPAEYKKSFSRHFECFTNLQ